MLLFFRSFIQPPSNIIILVVYSFGASFFVCMVEKLIRACYTYDMDIEPDDIEVSDTVTIVWEIV